MPESFPLLLFFTWNPACANPLDELPRRREPLPAGELSGLLLLRGLLLLLL